MDRKRRGRNYLCDSRFFAIHKVGNISIWYCLNNSMYHDKIQLLLDSADNYFNFILIRNLRKCQCCKIYVWKENHFPSLESSCQKADAFQNQKQQKWFRAKNISSPFQGFIFLDIIYIYIFGHFYTNKL